EGQITGLQAVLRRGVEADLFEHRAADLGNLARLRDLVNPDPIEEKVAQAEGQHQPIGLAAENLHQRHANDCQRRQPRRTQRTLPAVVMGDVDGHRLGAASGYGVSTIFPASVPAFCSVFSSCRRWASAACASGSTRSMRGFNCPDASQRLMSDALARCSSGVALNIAKPNSEQSLT